MSSTQNSSLLDRLRLTASLPISPYGLCVFRALFSIVMLGEVLQLFWFRHLIFDPMPGIREASLSNPVWWIPWFLSLAALIVGYRTRIAALVNYACCIFVLGYNLGPFVYHMDWYLIQVSLLFVFLPTDACFSISTRHNPERRRRVALWCPALIVFCCLPVVYLDSVFHKLDSEMWTKGLSVWLPCSLPQGTQVDLTPLLNREAVVRGMSYFVWVFETLFIVLVLFRRLRAPVAIAGAAFHAGIAVMFPIPFFGIGVAVVYLMLIPDSFWQKLFGPARDIPACGQLSRGQFLLLSGVVVMVIVAQSALVVFKAKLARNAVAQFTGPALLDRAEQDWDGVLTSLNRWTGLAPHWVYVDSHFRDYNHIVAVFRETPDGQEFLPVTRPSGLAGPWSSGRLFVHWTFRTNSPAADPKRLSEGIERYTAFWRHQSNLPPQENLTFQLVYKKLEYDFEWEPNQLQRLIAAPWQPLGTAQWNGDQCEVTIPDELEALP